MILWRNKLQLIIALAFLNGALGMCENAKIDFSPGSIGGGIAFESEARARSFKAIY
jgi:hypothetical protein